MSIIAICTGSALIVAADQRGAGRERLARCGSRRPWRSFRPCRRRSRSCAQARGKAPASRSLRPPVRIPACARSDAWPVRLRRVLLSTARSRNEPTETLVANVMLDLGDVAADDGADIGVGDDRRATLELAVFARKAHARRRRTSRMVLLKDGLGARFVVMAGVTIEKQDGRRLDAISLQHAAESCDLRSHPTPSRSRHRRARVP